MCGIAGAAGWADRSAAELAVKQMVASLARRGPDSEGLHAWDRAVLGHRRLSIFDLSPAGHQPMLSPDGLVGVVFNGAIYNFRDLRADLTSAGYAFQSQADTEVLLHGYRHWGIDELVRRLHGMFAFGLWDNRTETLFLVRDRLGVKPLIYAADKGAITFASTTRAFQAAGMAGEVDPQAVVEFLEFGYVTDERTIYRNTRKVPAATILEFHAGQIRSRAYWSWPQAADSGGPSWEETLQHTETLFLEAVRRRLDADVPVGVLLSGGVDSSLVCWAVARLGADITAFTVATPGEESDESADARHTAETLQLRHQIIPMSAEEPADVSQLVSAYGEPFACGSALGLLRVSEAVKPLATVLLTGDGGDDLFLGYPEHRHFYLAQRLARITPRPAAPLWKLLRGTVPHSGWLRRAVHFLDYATGGLGAITNARDGLPFYQRAGMLGERLRSASLPDRALPWSLASARNVLSDFIAYDRRTRFLGEYMTKVDGATMYHALEARAPFLDQQLWEFAGRLPYELLLAGGRLKAILRELARRHVSPHIAAGRKRGFTIPVERWMAGMWRHRLEEVLEDSMLEREGWISAAATRQQLELASRRGRAPKQLWYVLVLESWLRHERTLRSTQSSGGPQRL